MVLLFCTMSTEKREQVVDLLSFLTKSADGGINPLSWMKSLRDEILLRKVNERRI